MGNRTRIGLLLVFAAAVGGRSAVAQSPAAVTPAAVAKGDTLFHTTGNCYACHGAKGEGAVGPNLTDAEWIHSDGSYDGIVKQINDGVTQQQSKSGIPMPPKGGATLTDDQVKAMAAYVYSISHKKS